MPYLTPDVIPEGTTCRSLLIPESSDWLAIVSGALTELTLHWNWEQGGAVTVEQALAVMQTMINGYYEGCAADCEAPGGGSIIRINAEGEIEVLQGGEWVEPTEGDYYIPPPDVREGGTEDDQNCLAARNAVNVLHTLYSDLSNSFSEELTAAEALERFILAAVTAIGFAFAPITFGIAVFFFGIFELLYRALSYLTADLWTEDFEDQVVCFLLDCALNEGGVVTFDWECFNDKLNSLANDFSLTEVQLRLYLQVGYILQFIGGADGLNLAGRTTEIEDDDCSFCNDVWCVEWDQALFESEWTFDFASHNNHFYVDAHIDLGNVVAIVGGCFDYSFTGTLGGSQAVNWFNEDYSTLLDVDPLCAPDGTSFLNTPHTLGGIAINPVDNTASGNITVTRVKLWGTGIAPTVGLLGCTEGCTDLCL